MIKPMKMMLLASLMAVGLVSGTKHASAADDEIKLSYKVGKGLTFDAANGDFKMTLSGRVQSRFTYTGLEQANDTDTFAIQRGKIKLEGFTLQEKLKFGFQMNLATKSAASTSAFCEDGAGIDVDGSGGCVSSADAVTKESTAGIAVLEDYYVDYTPFYYFGIKTGQFKVPYLMQELTSSGNQQFVDRALATTFFNFARDIGLNFHGNLFEKKANYSLFVFNGDGANNFNANQGVAVGTRLEIIPLGEYKYSESDVENSQEPNFGFGLAYIFADHGTNFQNKMIVPGDKASHGTFDAGFKYKGFSVQTAAMVTRTHEDTAFTNWGYNAQVGYFVIPEHLELAARANSTVFSDAVANQHEYAGGINYFIKGHGIKLQTDYSLVMNNRGSNLNDHRIRTQLQVVF